MKSISPSSKLPVVSTGELFTCKESEVVAAIVAVSVPASVVIVILAPSAKVSVSVVVSATILSCPPTEIVPNRSWDPPPPDPTSAYAPPSLESIHLVVLESKYKRHFPEGATEGSDIPSNSTTSKLSDLYPSVQSAITGIHTNNKINSFLTIHVLL